jgi:SET domain-containing protein
MKGFEALRDIKEGEELTVEYSTYSGDQPGSRLIIRLSSFSGRRCFR